MARISGSWALARYLSVFLRWRFWPRWWFWFGLSSSYRDDTFFWQNNQ